jgi:uncharacterized surface protein with fasciclin (FAS1) repeats
MKKFRIYVLLVTLLLSVASIRCSSGASLLKAGSPLLSALGGVPNLSTLTGLMQTPGLDKLLGGVMKKPFTLLAPTNDALNSLGAGALSNLTSPGNVEQLANLLKNQIVPGKMDAAGLMQSGVTTAAGKALNLGGANLGSLISDDKFNILPIDKVLPG